MRWYFLSHRLDSVVKHRDTLPHCRTKKKKREEERKLLWATCWLWESVQLSRHSFGRSKSWIREHNKKYMTFLCHIQFRFPRIKNISDYLIYEALGYTLMIIINRTMVELNFKNILSSLDVRCYSIDDHQVWNQNKARWFVSVIFNNFFCYYSQVCYVYDFLGPWSTIVLTWSHRIKGRSNVRSL